MIPFLEAPSARVGPLTINAFGVIVAAAVFVGLSVGARRFRQLGFEKSRSESFAWWVVVGGFLGAHLFSVLFYFPRKVAENPLVLLKFWEDISSFGGILGGALGMLLFFRLRGRDMDSASRWSYIGVAAYVFPIALMIGRMGCAVAHDHPGLVTDFALAVSLETPEARAFIAGVYGNAGLVAALPPDAALSRLGFHDLGWYELLYLAVIVVPAVLLLGRSANRPEGILGGFILLYMPVRFLLDFLRVADVRYAGLTPAQWLALAALSALPVAAYRLRRPR